VPTYGTSWSATQRPAPATTARARLFLLLLPPSCTSTAATQCSPPPPDRRRPRFSSSSTPSAHCDHRRTSSSFRHRCPLAHRVLLLPTTAAMDHAASPAIIAPLAASRPENQLTQFGDGFIGFVSTYLGNHCKELIWMGLHPSEIIVGYNKVISKVCSHFQSDRSGIIKTCRM
jgi:hypothetical protein